MSVLRDRVVRVVRLGLDRPQTPAVFLGDQVDTQIPRRTIRPLVPQPHLSQSTPILGRVLQEPLDDALELLASPVVVTIELIQQRVEARLG